MVIHDVPAIDLPPSPITITQATCLGQPFMHLGCKPEVLWEWLRTTPVWPKLVADVPKLMTKDQFGCTNLECAELECCGHVDSWGEPQLSAIGLPVMIQFDCPDHFNISRQSWTIRRTRIAVSVDGTRGTVIETQLLAGPNEAREMALESLAWREGGGIPDVD